MNEVNGSIVLYHDQEDKLLRAINSFLNTNLQVKLYLVDNSSNDNLKKFSTLDDRIEYIFNDSNLGYGKAHNIAIRESIKEGVPYHVVLNSDVYFSNEVIKVLYDFMNANPDVGLTMPKILYPNGELQYHCKLLPTPFDSFGRRFLNWGPFKKYVEKRNYIYELRFTNYDKIMNVPYLCGCFMFLRVSALKEIGFFDEHFFMYPEDIDLTRRIHKKYKTLYYPHVYVVHEHQRASYKNMKMLFIHAQNMAKYYNKWGWFFDKERSIINKKTLCQLKYH